MRITLCCLWLITIVSKTTAQEISVKYGGDEVALNQVFTITLTIENERLKNYSPFPEIDGFLKRGTSSSTSTSFINGKMTSSQSIIQNYQPTREGTFRIPDFQITANGKKFNVPGTTVKVGPPAERSQRSQNSVDPFDFFNRRNRGTQQFVDVEAEAFLALTTDKTEVYVGEGFTTTLAFYVAESNRADMRFYELGKQITEIVKQIKPENCWEENFNIDNINGQPVTLNGKPYTQYKIFQAAYYPLNTEDIDFGSVGLKLIKYKVAKNPSFFGRNRQEDFETFYSKPKQIQVNELPPHPLRESVAVGSFILNEEISSKTLNTGQSFNYAFKIRGEGNISSIDPPMIPENEDFDFYEPNIQQNIRRSQNIVTGTKAYNYYGIPNEPGQYSLGDYMRWVFFDPDKEQYDTLRSNIVVTVSGESRKNEYISSNDLGSFYDQIQFESNALSSLSDGNWMRFLANGVVLVTLLLLITLRRKVIVASFSALLKSAHQGALKVLVIFTLIQALCLVVLFTFFPSWNIAFIPFALLTPATIIALGRILLKDKGFMSYGDMAFYSLLTYFLAVSISALAISLTSSADFGAEFLMALLTYGINVFFMMYLHSAAHFFQRHGYNKWYALIPFYNLYIFCKIAEREFIVEFFLALIPIVNLYFGYLFLTKLCAKQRIDGKYAILGVILSVFVVPKILYDNPENYARIYKFGYGK